MKSTVEHLSPTRVRINVEVPFAELQPDIDNLYRQLAKQIRIPGFRPGKAPAKLLEARIGRGAVIEQVVNDSLEKRYTEAVSSVDLRPVGKPDIEVTKIEDGDELVFTAEVDVRPEISIPDLNTLKITVDPIKVTDEEVDAELQSLRTRFATVTAVERPTQKGDLVSIDLSATVDGKEVSDASTQGLSYEAGSGRLVAELDEVILGMNAGDTKVFTTTLAQGTYAGQEAEVTVTVHAVKERELPEPDDEFAQLASEFDTIDELRASLRDQAERAKRVQQAEEIRDVALTELLDQVDIPLPEGIVQTAVDHIVHDEIERHGHDAARFAEALTARGSSREEFDANARENAEKGVKTQLVVDAVADELKIQVGQDDLTQRLVLQSRQYGVEPQQLLKFMQENNQLPAMFADVRRGKALAAVVRAATVTDTDGNPIDTEEFFGLEGDEAAAVEAAVEGDVIDEIDEDAEADEAGQVDEGDEDLSAPPAQDETEEEPNADESK